jgi:hypothetical protein
MGVDVGAAATRPKIVAEAVMKLMIFMVIDVLGMIYDDGKVDVEDVENKE